MIMEKMKNPEEFLFRMFELSEEESDALHGFIPMTEDLYFSILGKSLEKGSALSAFREKFMLKYPEYMEEDKNLES